MAPSHLLSVGTARTQPWRDPRCISLTCMFSLPPVMVLARSTAACDCERVAWQPHPKHTLYIHQVRTQVLPSMLAALTGMGATQRLIRAVGKSKAMEMILSGRRMTAHEAEACGLVSRVVPQAELMSEAMKLAETIARFSKPVVAKAKDCIKRSMEMPLAEGIRYEQCVLPPTSCNARSWLACPRYRLNMPCSECGMGGAITITDDTDQRITDSLLTANRELEWWSIAILHVCS